MKNKIRLLSIIILSIAILLSGCWSRKELKNIGVVGFLAMDQEDELVDMTVEILTPKRVDSTTEEKAVKIYQSSGETISCAISKVSDIYEHELILSHTNVYIFTEKIAEEGVDNYIEFLNRYYQARRYVHIAITKDMEISDLVEIANNMDEPISQHIEDLFDNYTKGGQSASIKMIDFLKNYYEEGIEPVAGVVSRSTVGSNSEDISVEGLAVFKGDELVGFFNGEETKSYNLVTNKLESCVYVTDPDNAFGKVSIEVLEASSSFDMQLNNNELSMSVMISMKGMINEALEYTAITDNEIVQAIQDNLSEKIAAEVKSSISKAQDYGADIFGFGQYMHRYHPKIWEEVDEDWAELFQSIDIKVEVEMVIERVGATNESVDLMEN
jgi:spore germination protein KC